MDNCIVEEITKEELLEQLDPRWKKRLDKIEDRLYWDDIVSRINASIAEGKLVMPSISRIFQALNKTPMDKFRVLLIGQDPYPNIGVATGYAFSLFPGEYLQSSLERIFVEIDNEYGSNLCRTHKSNGSLVNWVNQGVMLLNTVLTTDGYKSPHMSCKWQKFVHEVVEYLDANYRFVTIALGAEARKVAEHVVSNKDLIITAGHPSARNASSIFIGSNCFAKCNDLLIKNELMPINWILPK